MIKVDLSGAKAFWGEKGPDWEKCAAAHETLAAKTGPGADFTGWTWIASSPLRSGSAPWATP